MAGERVDIASRLTRRLGRADLTRQRMEHLFRSGRIVRRDVEAVYEGLYVQAVSAFESFIAELFRALLLASVPVPGSRIARRVTFSSSPVLSDVLHGNRRYLDWLPYDQTEERARVYLRGGRPFTDVTPTDKDRLQRVVWTRNAIAHQSAFARNRFEENVIGATPLLSRERTPAGYLRTMTALPPAPTQFEVMLADLGRIAVALCT
jgi:hypothetical protein